MFQQEEREKNRTGIPDEMKARAEQKSGMSFSDVRVHRNSELPPRVGALACTQGNDVYLGAGQERYLGHELGHVVQQRQNRVPVTGTVNGAAINDDPGLEAEAERFL
jgi:hypothetical protein